MKFMTEKKMKRRLFSLIALILVAFFTLSGCDGCTTYPELSFNNAFNGGSGEDSFDAKTNYTEVIKYTVVHDASTMNEELKNNENVTVSIQNGEYQTTLRVLSSFSEAETQLKTIYNDQTISIKSDIIDSLTENNLNAYMLESKLSIPVKYTFLTAKGTEEVLKRVDTITSTAIFCNRSFVYAPIYSHTVADYTILQYNGAGAVPIITQSTSKIKYQKDSYSVEYVYNGESYSGVKSNSVTISNTYDYKYKTVVDNAMLFFALRNFPIENQKVEGLPTVVANYGEAQLLAVKNAGSITQRVEDLSYNGEKESYDISVSTYTFNKNEADQAGAMQKVYIQNKVENSPVPYKSLMIKYEEPLTTGLNYVSLGSLVYTLSSIEFSK